MNSDYKSTGDPVSSYKLSEKVSLLLFLLLFNLPKAKVKTRMVFFLSLFLASLFFVQTYTKTIVLGFLF